MADERKNPLDQALDLFVYAPLGLMLTAKDELPKLIEKGRTRTTSQLTMAKMIGHFAVTQGQTEVTKRVAKVAADVSARAPQRRAPQPPARTGGAAAVADLGDSQPAADPLANLSVSVGGTSANGSNGHAPSTGPDADLLAIPGYDSLSASQVVQRLAGLSPIELAAVGAYETEHRGRRTILSKVSQLQSEHP